VWLVVLPALCCLSCSGGSGLNPVQGKVLYKDQPLAGAVVTFHPKGADQVTAVPAVGRTKEDGTFTLTTGTKEGAPAGEYVVTIICPEEPKTTKGFSTEAPDTPDRFRGAYAKMETSPFKVQIKSGPNTLEPFPLK
jgi:hypothetical protein